jgi:hypothetical protein
MREFIALYVVIGVLYARVCCWEAIASKESEPGLVVVSCAGECLARPGLSRS